MSMGKLACPETYTGAVQVPALRVISATEDGKVFDDEDAQLVLDKGTPRLYIMRLPKRGLQFNRITYHGQVTQCLSGMDPSTPWYIVVAKPSGSAEAYPKEEDLTAFRIPHGTYIKMNMGTWHAGPLFDGSVEHMDFANLELADTNAPGQFIHNAPKSTMRCKWTVAFFTCLTTAAVFVFNAVLRRKRQKKDDEAPEADQQPTPASSRAIDKEEVNEVLNVADAYGAAAAAALADAEEQSDIDLPMRSSSRSVSHPQSLRTSVTMKSKSSDEIAEIMSAEIPTTSPDNIILGTTSGGPSSTPHSNVQQPGALRGVSEEETMQDDPLHVEGAVSIDLNDLIQQNLGAFLLDLGQASDYDAVAQPWSRDGRFCYLQPRNIFVQLLQSFNLSTSWLVALTSMADATQLSSNLAMSLLNLRRASAYSPESSKIALSRKLPQASTGPQEDFSYLQDLIDSNLGPPKFAQPKVAATKAEGGKKPHLPATSSLQKLLDKEFGPPKFAVPKTVSDSSASSATTSATTSATKSCKPFLRLEVIAGPSAGLIFESVETTARLMIGHYPDCTFNLLTPPLPPAPLSGPSAGLIFESAETMAKLVIGRYPDCTFNLADQEVSGRHATFSFHRETQSWKVADMGSLNGIVLNTPNLN
eukprot:gene3752-13813_t